MNFKHQWIVQIVTIWKSHRDGTKLQIQLDRRGHWDGDIVVGSLEKGWSFKNHDLGYVDMIKVMRRDDNRRPCIQNHKKCVAIQDGMQVLYLERADHHHHRHSYPRHHYVHHHHPHHHHDYGLDTWQVKMELRSDLLRGPIWIWFETLWEESAWYVLSTNLDMMMLMVVMIDDGDDDFKVEIETSWNHLLLGSLLPAL